MASKVTVFYVKSNTIIVMTALYFLITITTDFQDSNRVRSCHRMEYNIYIYKL